MKGKQVPFTSGVAVVSVLIVVTALVIIGRLFFLQILRGKDFEERADRQFVGSASTVFDRGNIYFTRKDGQKLEAATVIVNYKLAISPKSIYCIYLYGRIICVFLFFAQNKNLFHSAI
jgi:cell division protein FtsI/penicillin-binding protein 2